MVIYTSLIFAPQMDLMRIFAKNLKLYRTARGLSQEALAHQAGLDRTYISALERGLYSASIVTIERIAKALDVEPALLLQRIGKGQGQKS